jgi:hypothetical protein
MVGQSLDIGPGQHFECAENDLKLKLWDAEYAAGHDGSAKITLISHGPTRATELMPARAEQEHHAQRAILVTAIIRLRCRTAISR